MIIPVILSGGSGTRLWPLSRKLHPKQFISLVNDTTLFQDTILRLPKNVSEPIIVCNEEHRFLAAEQLRQINKKTKGIILEPEGRNTAPAITLSALKLKNEFEDPILLVLSADHLIKNEYEFHQSIHIAERLAKDNKLITFGIFPNKLETSYGYIEFKNNKIQDHYKIQSFTEKPNEENAKKYIESGNYLWNSGMFMFKASTFLSELEKFEPNILVSCMKSLDNEKIDSDFIRIDNDAFRACPNQSIDIGIMERTNNAVVVPLNANWSDVGSWSSLWNEKNKDSSNNVIEGDVILEDVENTFIHSSNRLVSVLGVSDLVIIDTQDALLVTKQNLTQNLLKITKQLKRDGRTELENHRKVFRPWGYFDSIDTGKGFQVKRIVVNPDAKLSLQRHKYRAEHWVVVKGIALVTCDHKVFELKENQSTYIPKGSLHRLENLQDAPLEIIEIQTGSYLGEDDIIRIKDDYQRN